MNNPLYDTLLGETLMDPVPERSDWFDPPTAMLPPADRHEPPGEEPPGLTYSRFVPFTAGFPALVDTEAHVRAHLSSVADADDDPDTRSEDTRVEHRPQESGTLIVGFLPNAEASAPYLQPGYDPLGGIDAATLQAAGVAQ